MDRVESNDTKAARLGAIIAAAAEAGGLAEALFAQMRLKDLDSEPVAEAAATARALWALMAERPAATPLIRVAITEAGLLPRAVIELVNDDMPFLVDSVAAELDRHGFDITRILHPIVRVERDGAGRLTAFGTGAKESVMRIEASGRDMQVDATVLAADLRRVLDDVRAAVCDWPAMRGRVHDCLTGFEAGGPPPGLTQIELHEACAFLRWLDDNNFTFLGYRAYRFVGARMDVVAGSGLGLLRDDAVQVLDGARDLSSLPDAGRDLLERHTLVICTKAARKSTVHRRTHLDLIGVKNFDADGNLIAEHRFVGLFTSHAYHASPFEVPLLRHKLADVLAQAGFDPASHDGKALTHILETYPRDELFQIDGADLGLAARGILDLQERRACAAFVRLDPFRRFVSVLAYVPEARYSPGLRQRFSAVLQEIYAGEAVDMHTLLHSPPLVRLHLVVQLHPGAAVPDVDPQILSARLAEIARGWTEKLGEALAAAAHPQAAARLARWSAGFPTAYVEGLPAQMAVADIDLAETALATGRPACHLGAGSGPDRLGFRLALAGDPGSLSDILPMLERRGLRVLTEADYVLQPADGPVVYLHAFDCVVAGFTAPDPLAQAAALAAGFTAGWTGAAEEDGYNRLTLAAGLGWRDIALLRAYAKYLKQAGLPYTHASLQDALVRNPGIVRRLVDYFYRRFDPAAADGGAMDADSAVILAELDAVTALDEDRILRRLFDAMRNTLRTNFFVGLPDAPRAEIALKLDSEKLDALPKPRPWREIFVCAPRLEAIHLRGGKVARGGIRWSDRRDDFRTEVLGLMKAQMVKNTVIVPVGSKGGFVVKRPPAAEAGRAALLEEVVACYRAMMHALLDITDNRVGGAIQPPPQVVRRDGDDPYLVVAADKGTATFSDIANDVAESRGFWLGDAFASGGSAGYDHKGLGITARGAWVAVERHLREAGIPLDGLRLVGVGDMSGDVFGNGLLHADKLRLLAAFDHRHIFLDPDPDPVRSFAERRRLFDLKGSSWADYDPALISAGGGVFARSLKRIDLTPQIRDALGLAATVTSLTPAELIQAILCAPVDLLWFGGIGTYIKAASESQAEAGDRVNDAVRVDGAQVRARVIGEGANLGVTQKGRLEIAAGGGRIDTDAIANSAGVDCSDHEVNLKILFGDVLAAGRLDRAGRDALLAAMADEVCAHVLADNARQTQALSLAESQGAGLIDALRPLLHHLETSAGLDRDLESLPADAELERRRNTGKGLLRPELAVVLGFVKLGLYPALLAAPVIDDPALEGDLFGYFPARLADPYADEIRRHGLRRELIATTLTNQMVDRCGLTFADTLGRAAGRAPGAVARAFVIIRAALAVGDLWNGLDAITRTVPAADLTTGLLQLADALHGAVAWELRQSDAGADAGADAGDIAARLAVLVPQITALAGSISIPSRAPASLGPAAAQIDRVIALADSLDVLTLAAEAGAPVPAAAAVHMALLDALCVPALRRIIAALPSNDRWLRQAAAGLLDDLSEAHRRHACSVLSAADGPDPASWLAARRDPLDALAHVVAELQAMQSPSLPRIVVAGRLVRALG